MTPDPSDLAALRIEARQRWGSATPYRLGLLVGARGLGLVNPYNNPRGRKCFADGVEWGHAHPDGLT